MTEPLGDLKQPLLRRTVRVPVWFIAMATLAGAAGAFVLVSRGSGHEVVDPATATTGFVADVSTSTRRSTTTIASTSTTTNRTPITTVSIAAPTTPPPLTTAPPTSTGLPDFTPAEIGGVIAGPATAWLMSPNGPAFDALASAARSLLDSGRVNDATLRKRLEELTAYPGNDQGVASTLYLLANVHAVPGLPIIIWQGGRVGVDFQPGKYRTIGPVRNCYWATLNEAGEINDNNFVNAAPQVIMTVASSDYAVTVENCGLWVAI